MTTQIYCEKLNYSKKNQNTLLNIEFQNALRVAEMKRRPLHYDDTDRCAKGDAAYDYRY